MPKQKRLVAEPVSKIMLLDTNVVVGWVYRWNNGDVQKAWLNELAEIASPPEEGRQNLAAPARLSSKGRRNGS